MIKKINKNKFGVLEYYVETDKDLEDIKLDDTDNNVIATDIFNVFYMYSQKEKKWFPIKDVSVYTKPSYKCIKKGDDSYISLEMNKQTYYIITEQNITLGHCNLEPPYDDIPEYYEKDFTENDIYVCDINVIVCNRSEITIGVIVEDYDDRHYVSPHETIMIRICKVNDLYNDNYPIIVLSNSTNDGMPT